MNWNDLYSGLDATQYHDSDQLKTDLSILFVLEANGHVYEQAEGGKYAARCPFHEDSAPSFDVFGENLERWGCYPCGDGGDVLDLVKRLYAIERFVEVKDKAAELLRAQTASGWSGPRKGVRREFDRDRALRTVSDSSAGADAAWRALYDSLAAERPALAAVDPQDIRIAFRLGVQDDWTIAPIYDREDTLVAYKRRKVGGKMLVASGADLTQNLYGEWLDKDRSKPVLLVEGETDAWAAHFALPEMAVLSVPTGAGSPATQAHTLNGRHVILAFDGDATGRRALRTWSDALKGIAKSVRVIVMPDDGDLASTEDIRALSANIQPIPSQTPKLAQKADGIYQIPRGEKAEPVQLSNFTLTASRQLVGDDLSAWECKIMPSGVDAVISTHDLASDRSLITWSARHGGSWFGSKVDAQHVQAMLQAEQPFLASGFTTSVAGLHRNHFIFPGGSIGPDHWVYTPGRTDVELQRYLEPLVRPEDDPDWNFTRDLVTVRQLHERSIMDPILAWLALAPLRSLISPFPTLAVLGGSGTGKTTLLETVLRSISGSEIGVNLASTSRFAIAAFTGATNSFPVWFDEYRPGAAADAITALDQIVRDAYNGHGSVKGGMGDHWAQVKMLKAEAPMIVSGEDAFTETSHLERIIPVYLPVDGRNPHALMVLQERNGSSWAWRWMEILRWAMITDQLDLSVTPASEEGLAPRMQYNLGVLQMGWGLLQQFAEMIDGADLGEPDFSRIVATLRHDAKGNPILDAIRWCLDEPNAAEFMIRELREDQATIFLRVENFVKYVQRAGTFTLPGNHKAVRRYIEEQMEGVASVTRIGGSQVRGLRIPARNVDQQEQ